MDKTMQNGIEKIAETLGLEGKFTVHYGFAQILDAINGLKPPQVCHNNQQQKPSRAQELAEAHWYGYVQPLIMAHGSGDELARLASFHYISAFMHGWKHREDEGRELARKAMKSEQHLRSYAPDGANCQNCSNERCASIIEFEAGPPCAGWEPKANPPTGI